MPKHKSIFLRQEPIVVVPAVPASEGWPATPAFALHPYQSIPVHLENHVQAFAQRHVFTHRQLEVFRVLLHEKAAQDIRTIAAALKIKPNTVNNHFKDMFEKTGAHSRTTLLACFIREEMK